MIRTLLASWNACYSNAESLKTFYQRYAGTCLNYRGVSCDGVLYVTRSGLHFSEQAPCGIMSLDDVDLIHILGCIPPYPRAPEGSTLIEDWVAACREANMDRFGLLCDYLGPLTASLTEEGLEALAKGQNILGEGMVYQLGSFLFPYLTQASFNTYQESVHDLERRIALLEAHDE